MSIRELRESLESPEVAPEIPPAKRCGDKRTVDGRTVLNGLMYLVSVGCKRDAIPKDFPPKGAIRDDFDRWNEDRTLERIHHALYMKCWEPAGREVSPTVAVIDSQSVRSAEKGACINPHEYDVGTKIKGKKRHVLVDTTGLTLHAIVHIYLNFTLTVDIKAW